MRVRHRRRMHLARHQPGEVGHVDNQVRAHLVRDGAHAREVELARVGAAAAHDHLRLLAQGGRFQLVVIHGLSVAAHLVADHAVELAGEVELVAVSQVAAVRQVQAQEGVAGIHQRHIRRGVGLRAGVRLHVGVFGPKDLLGAVARQVLHHVGELASAVVALAGIALGVLVGEDGAGRLQHRAADKVLRGDHLQPLVLAHDLMLDLAGNFRVGRSKACTQINWHIYMLTHGSSRPASTPAHCRAGNPFFHRVQLTLRQLPVLAPRVGGLRYTKVFCRPGVVSCGKQRPSHLKMRHRHL